MKNRKIRINNHPSFLRAMDRFFPLTRSAARTQASRLEVLAGWVARERHWLIEAARAWSKRLDWSGSVRSDMHCSYPDAEAARKADAEAKKARAQFRRTYLASRVGGDDR